MFKKFLLITCFIVRLNLLCTANLLTNKEFNTGNIGFVRAPVGTCKLSRHIDSDGNKCVKIELINFRQGKNGKQTNIALRIGDKKEQIGFAAKANTKYKFSLMLKGNQAKTIVKAEELHKITSPLWKSKLTRLKTRFSIPVKVEADKWNRVEGTFTTSAKVKRACITVAFWWDEKHGPTMYKKGDYVLIDKIVIEEAPDKLATLSSQNKSSSKKFAIESEKIVQVSQESANPIIDGKLDDACWTSIPTQADFRELYTKKKASVKSQFKIFRNGKNIYLGVKCFEPNMNKLASSISQNGRGIWKDDLIEIFFAPAFESAYLQLVVSAGGGRYTGDGTKEMDVLYERWEAKVHKDKDYWSIECKIPYTLMWATIKNNSIQNRLNISRQRKQSPKLSTWSPMLQGLRSVNEYGRMFFGNIKQWSNVQIAQLKNEIANLSEPTRKKIRKDLQSLDIRDISKFYNQIQTIKEQIKFARVANRKFVLTEVARHRSPRIPLIPEQLSNPPTKITLTAAVNEVRSIPLAITNLTNKTAEYQVLLCSEKINRADEKPGLKKSSGRFPMSKIKCLRAIRIKDNDNTGTAIRFDPLVDIDRSYTVSAPSKDSALFYYKFDCRDMKPGIYKGFIYIFPLSEPTLSNDPKKLPQMQSFPFELTVLPIKLSKEFRTPFMFTGLAKSEEIIKFMLNEGIVYFPIQIWGMSAKFDDKGNIISYNNKSILNNILQQRKCAQKYRPGAKLKYFVIAALYRAFMRRFAKKRFKVGTKEWKNGYKNWVKLFVELRDKAGIAPSDFIVQVADEPGHNKHHTSISQVLEVCKITKQVAPDLMTAIPYSSSTKAKDLYPLIPYLDVWKFWDGLLYKKGYDQLVKNLRKANKQVWIYRCNTGISSDLYSYYRLHAWRGENKKVDVVSLFQTYSAPRGYATSWRMATTGNYLMLYGDVFSSVRNECLITGFNDLKYYDKLEKVTKQAKARGKVPDLVRKAEKLLRYMPGKIIRNTNDFRLTGVFRKEAIDLILKLQK